MLKIVPAFVGFVSFFLLSISASPLPVVPRRVSPAGSWPSPGTVACGSQLTTNPTAYCGDVRAVLNISSGDIVNGISTVQIYWRRRDPTPWLKAVLVNTYGSNPIPQQVTQKTVESVCGIISFKPSSGPGLYAVYFLPFVASDGNAWTNFNWLGCNDTTPNESNQCVLGGQGPRQEDGSSVCEVPQPNTKIVVALENRDEFNAFSEMETMATPSEVNATRNVLLSKPSFFVGVFPEPRELSVRVFDVPIPARWSSPQGIHNPLAPQFNGVIVRGEWFSFQLGLWEYRGKNLTGLKATTTGLSSSGSTIPASEITFVNLEGVDVTGASYVPNFWLPPNWVGSLWVGVNVPKNAIPGSIYTGTVLLTSDQSTVPISVSISLTVSTTPSVENHGDSDITKLTRLRWLYSKKGLEDSVPHPFSSPIVLGNNPLTFQTSMSTITVDSYGLIRSINTQNFDTLAKGFNFLVIDQTSQPIHFTIKSPATITQQTASELTWTSEWISPSFTVSVTGQIDFTNYVSYTVEVTATDQVSVNDIQLTYQMSSVASKYIVGMDMQGSQYSDHKWRWSNTTCTNKVWIGVPESGLVLNLKGEGMAWNSPMFGKDFPVIPFVPSSWGGFNVLPINNPNGVNIVNASVVAFSGARSFTTGKKVKFLFDVAITPSKQMNYTKHWNTRAIQVGYNTDYMTPQQVRDMGATVVTLHQGTPGIINGSLVNPYISYPFGNDVVPLLTNYTAQSNALGMATKFYYTIRELSTRATETFAFLAQRGEIFVDQDPYIIVQPGYAQGWDNHGGSPYLHQHLVSHYASCWQQTLSTGDWDPSICDYGISRLFNFYVEGLWWSFTQPPFINGIYYDGINFPRLSMIRIRRTADKAAATQQNKFPALLDLHTGRDPTPPACSYASHYPLIDYVWNGEGFDYSQGPSYWLVEVSSRIHGLSGDLLGSSHDVLWRGMLFGMTDRNSQWSSNIWQFWDQVNISSTTAIGWWETVPSGASKAPVQLTYTCSSSTDPEHNQILATVYYVFGSHAIIVVGSWCSQTVNVNLSFQNVFGFDPMAGTLTAPSIPNVQQGNSYPSPNAAVSVPGNQGVILLLKK